jgi:hypothetical protein
MSEYLYRYTKDGRRVHVAFSLPYHRRRVGYVIEDARLRAFERRRFWSFVFSAVAAPIVLLELNSYLWAVPPVVLAVSLLSFRMFVVAGLPRISVSVHELQPVDHHARTLAQFKALGEPALWVLLVLGVLLTGVAVFFILLGGRWLGFLVLFAFGGMTAFMGRGILLVREARRALNSSE